MRDGRSGKETGQRQGRGMKARKTGMTGMILHNGRTRLVAVLAVALLVVAVLGVVAAGCGGDEDLPSAGGSDTTGTTTAGSTSTTADGTATTQAPAALSGSLNGAGATFPKPLYVEWIGEFQIANPDVKINYQGIGSGGGIEQFTKLTVDFGASDAPMKDEEITAAEAGRRCQGAAHPHRVRCGRARLQPRGCRGAEARLRHPGRPSSWARSPSGTTPRSRLSTRARPCPTRPSRSSTAPTPPAPPTSSPAT